MLPSVSRVTVSVCRLAPITVLMADTLIALPVSRVTVSVPVPVPISGADARHAERAAGQQGHGVGAGGADHGGDVADAETLPLVSRVTVSMVPAAPITVSMADTLIALLDSRVTVSLPVPVPMHAGDAAHRDTAVGQQGHGVGVPALPITVLMPDTLIGAAGQQGDGVGAARRRAGWRCATR